MKIDQESLKRLLPWMLPVMVGALIRSLVVASNPHTLIWDEKSYQALAIFINSGGESAKMPFWPPGWPHLIATLYKVFGTSEPRLILWFNVVISVLSLIFLGLLTSRLFSRKTSLIAVWLMAMMPSYILANTLLIYEVWMQFLLIVVMYLASIATWTWRRTGIITLICGGLALIRPTWLIMPVVLWLMNLVLGTKPKLNRLIVMQIGTILLVAPWVIYASISSGQFVPIAMQGGLHLWMANNPNATGTHVNPPGEYWNPAYDSVAREEAINFIIQNPTHLVTILPAKLWYMFRGEPWTTWFFFATDPPFPPASATFITNVSNIYYYLIFILFLLGIVRSIKKRNWPGLGAMIPLCAAIVTQIALFTGQLKYRWPMQFILIMYAAFAIVWMTRWDKTERLV